MKLTNAATQPSATMLRVELFTVEPVRPTCSTYLRKLCMFAASHAGIEMQPEEIFPRIEDRDRRQDRSPDDRRDRELRPNAPAQFLVPNRRTAAEEGPHEKKRREQQSHREFEHSRQDARPARHLRMDEGPELFVALGGEVGVVQLMRRAVEAEAHQAEDADEDTVDFIQAAGSCAAARATPRESRSACRA